MRYRLDRFCFNLEVACAKKKMTPRELCDEIGAPRSRADKWKNHGPSLLDTVCICEVLKISIEDLLK